MTFSYLPNTKLISFTDQHSAYEYFITDSKKEWKKNVAYTICTYLYIFTIRPGQFSFFFRKILFHVRSSLI